MPARRIHVIGGSGSGTTTLARALATALGTSAHDADDYFWLPTDPPYRHRRDATDRLRLAREMFEPRDSWVLSGSLDGWGDALIPRFELVVLLEVATPVRLSRLRDRESRRFGAVATAPGGWRHEETEDFIEWASHYDDGTREGRTRARHEAWVAALPCPVLRLDGVRPLDELVADCLAAIAAAPRPSPPG